MKTVAMLRDYLFRVSPCIFVQYKNGIEYRRVPEVQASAIVAAGAGVIVEPIQ